jgi:protease-4
MSVHRFVCPPGSRFLPLFSGLRYASSMKKNPLVLLLAISGVFFVVFLLFVFITMGNIVKDRSLLARGGVNVGVVKLHGTIMESEKMLKSLKEMEEDSSVKAVILRIDSPGGAVGPSQEIHDAILRVKKTKPVVASFESVAASGGFYIAVAADRIVSNPGTLTGSIGVIMNMANLSELYKWAKVERYNIKSGKFKDVGTENRPMTEEEHKLMQNLIDNVYQQFLKAVADGRRLPIEKVQPYADGRVLSGEQAFELGLVDKLGGIDVAIDVVKELAHIDSKQKVNLVYPEPKRRSLLEVLGQEAASQFTGAILEKLGLPGAFSGAPAGQRGLYFF